MSQPEQLITEHIDIWTSAILAKSTVGRGSSKKYELYGIKKLRELILELAVRGKLVPQNPNDEPASVLIKRIAAENAQLIRDNKIKKTLPFSKVTKDEELFELPEGWIWARIANLFNVVYGKGLPTSKLTNKGYDVFGANGIIGKYETYSYEESQLLVSCRGAYSGKANLSPPKCFITSNTLVLENSWNNLNKKFYYYSISAADKSQIVTGSAQPQVTAKNLNPFLVSIPPLQEQHRIVAKVDELMLLCDQLEQQTEASIDAHATLVEILLATLTDSADANELAQNWARVSEYFDSLFTTEQSIEALKQTVLQLAVMGKLVPQNPEDEPASVLIEKIVAEKTRLIENKEIKPKTTLPPIANDEKIFDIPRGWEWCRLDDICNGITSGSTPPKSSFKDEPGIPYLKVYNIRNQEINFEYKPQFIDASYHSSVLKRSQLRPGDVGKIAIIPNTYPEWNCNQAIVMFRPIISDLNKFIYTYLVAGMFLKKIALIGTAGQDNISVTKSRSILLPTPPLEEQNRIVAKVDELMLLCDQLKDKLQQSQVTQIQLTDALIEKALA